MDRSAPLTELPDSPIPPNGGAEWFEGEDGAPLRAALFHPPGQIRGSVILSTGRTEPIEKYFEAVCDLQTRGFVVLVNEWRGQGLSYRELPDRLKGHASGLEPYLSDYSALLNAFEDRLPKPWIAIGHSMGGCLTLTAMVRGLAPRFVGTVLSAPMLGLRVPLFTRLVVAYRMMTGHEEDWVQPPSDPVNEPFEGNVLTHDPVRFKRAKDLLRANPDLALSSPTWGWLDFALRASHWVSRDRNICRLMLPVIIVSAGQDRLVKNAAQEKVAGFLPYGVFAPIAGAEHEILMETDPIRRQFWENFDGLAGRVAPKR